jgi:thiamine biosynthesis lipoprotein
VPSLLWEALVPAHRAFVQTRGLFDPTVLGRLQALGYDRSFPFPPPIAARDVGAVIGFGHVEIDFAAQTVALPMGCSIDLGGIGKGLAADRVIEGLLARGAVSACVSMGGDLRVAGPGPDRDDAWEVRVEDPRNDRDAFVFPLVDEALAQSSTMYRRWSIGQREVHHLIDPRTGEPSRSGVTCAVVSAREAWRAEVFAKAALLAGPLDGVVLLEQAGVDGWLLDEAGAVHTTTHVADVGWSTEPCVVERG